MVGPNDRNPLPALPQTSAGADALALRWRGVLGSAGDILQDSASDPRLAAASSSSSSGLALEIVGMGAGDATAAQQQQQQQKQEGGRGVGGRSVAEAAAAGFGKAFALSGRRRGVQTPQGGVVALAGAMSVEGRGGEGWRGPARGRKEGALLRRSVEAEDEHEANYR